MGYYVKYNELQAAQSAIINQINQWTKELEQVKKQVQAVAQMQEIKGDTADSIKNYMQEIHLPLIQAMQNVLSQYMTKMRLYCNEYYKLDTKLNAVMRQDRLDDQILVIQTRTGAFEEIEGKVGEGVGMASGLASVSMPSGVQVNRSYENLNKKVTKLMNQVGDCEYNHLRSDFQLMEELLRSILQVIRVNKNKVSVSISEYKLGSIVSLDAYQKLQNLSAKSMVEMEGVSQNALNYKEINAAYWNRTDHYFDKGWMDQKIKLEEALNVIRLETVEHGSLDILSLIKQYGHGSENYRLMALIRLAQLSQGTYDTKENITKVEDEEDRTQKVLTDLKEAKDNAGEFLEITGKFLFSQLPEPFKDIVMFCGGFSDRVLTNVFPGSNLMNEPYQETLLIPYTKGAIVGDIVSMVAGVLTTIIGGSMVVKGGLGVVIGTAATATGVGAVPGIAIDGASAGLIIEGVAVANIGIKLTLSASKNLGNDLQKLEEAKNSVDSELESGNKTLGVDELMTRDSKFLDENGDIDWEKWAPNGGRVPGTIKEGQTLDIGTVIDRYGNQYGKYTSPVGVPYEQRALPYLENPNAYHKYEVIKPIDNVTQSEIAKAFEQPGGGIQYELPSSIKQLIKDGFIKEIK